MRWTFETMGTVVSVSMPAGLPDRELRDAVEAVFADFDREFSRFRPESTISRIARGELLLLDAGERARDAYARSAEWRARTDGAFTPHRPDGVLDLDGIVKALAIEQAGAVLDAAGIHDWCLGCGGDVLKAGSAGAEEPWAIGVAHPDLAGAVIAQVAMTGDRRAIATSGTSERGEHVWRTADAAGAARAAGAAEPLRQVTVVARDIVTADVLATAILAGGSDRLVGLPAFAAANGVDVLAVQGERLIATPGLRQPERAGAAASARR